MRALACAIAGALLLAGCVGAAIEGMNDGRRSGAAAPPSLDRVEGSIDDPAGSLDEEETTE